MIKKKKKKSLDCLEEIVGKYSDVRGDSGEGLQGREGHGEGSVCHGQRMCHREQDVGRHQRSGDPAEASEQSCYWMPRKTNPCCEAAESLAELHHKAW